MITQRGGDSADSRRPSADIRTTNPPLSPAPSSLSLSTGTASPSPRYGNQPSPSPRSRTARPDNFLPKHLNTSFASSLTESPTQAHPDAQDDALPLPSRSGTVDVSPAASGRRYSPQQTLKPSSSMPNVRQKRYSPFQVDKASPRSSPLGLSPSRTNHHYYTPELHFDVPPPSRTSLQSSMTVTSSIDPASGTERSSVATKTSSTTELSPKISEEDEEDEEDQDESGCYTGGGMSVDDAIDMYLDGFADDPPPTAKRKSKIQPARTDTVPASDIPAGAPPETAEAGPPPTPVKLPEPPRSDSPPSTPQRTLPSSIPAPPMITEVTTNGEPPALLTPTKTRDQYGFRKATTHVTIEQYDSWYESYSGYQKLRSEKWYALLKSSGIEESVPTTFPIRSAKLKKYIRKGIPPECRGAAWFWYAGGYDHIRRNPGLYKRLVETALRSPMNDDKEHIERDLHRTFPDNVHFKPDSLEADSSSGSSNLKYSSASPDTPIIQSLRRVLYAFSLHNSNIGYTQSLNFIAGFLILFLPEEKAFWLLHIITSSFFPGTHEISLEGANADLWILMVALKESLPSVYTKVVSTTPTNAKTKPPTINTATRLPDITLGLTNWLMSMFISTLPFETTLRVWDVLFYEGSRTFFRVALSIFRMSQKQIVSLGDPMEIFQVVQTAPKRMIDPNELMMDCFARRFKLSQARVETLREARRIAIREGKDRISYLAGPRKFKTDPDGRPSTGANTPSPSTWRSFKSFKQ
ncbi:GTPase-activating protein gyp3 [Arthroderma uncinatum]|uniref:GTPase-activating protein gyp3 n=1 Tax=Arthroderma uncinatum TaxID=74035 RepID=UPI00144AF530|nr:GTPase-activating protein gyp3 [Arthroderma uncinatum]KAF3492269.1 GTPase-activating protein gyp3 [Arthroderma uncinatum]